MRHSPDMQLDEYVALKHHKAFMVDLKPVYRAVSKEAAKTALDELEAKWGQQYPVVLSAPMI